MRYGTPPRPAHRATVDGGPVLLVRGIGSPGLHRPSSAPPQRRDGRPPARRRAAPRPSIEPQRAVLWLTQALAGVIMLGLALTIGFLVLSSDRHQRASVTLAPPPSGVAEVFPGDELRPAGATGAYRIELRHSGADCGEATSGGLTAVLVAHGCREVVRAALTTPYPGDYRVTAGMVTLADADGAAEVDERVRGLIETGDGGFTTLPGGGDASTGQVGWHVRGNYLLYCVITRPDGAVVPADDPYAARITADLVDTHLGGSVLGRRAAPPQPPGARALSS